MSIDLTTARHVHFVGIAGAGMSALARLLLARGHVVSGSDQHGRETGRALSAEGARIYHGHRAGNVCGADLVVVSAAISGGNPEIEAAVQAGISVVKRAVLMGAIMNAGRGIAIAGTHGKTTTTALISHIAMTAGLDPTVLIGGVSLNFGSNARVGTGPLVIVEADEYDSSFLQLQPEIAVITNLAPEHLDYYGSEERLHAAFQQFAAGVHHSLVFCADDPVLGGLLANVPARTVTYGVSGGDWRAGDIRERGGRSHFEVEHGEQRVPVTTSLAGTHNVRNALAALAVADLLEIELRVAVDALGSFHGVQRRFEIKGERSGVLVMDDYAVHPNEVRATLGAANGRYRRPIRLIFQPHTYSRTKTFLAEFAQSFEAADRVYVMDIYAARETDTLGVSGRTLVRAAEQNHPGVVYTDTVEATVAAVLRDVQPGDLVMTMGAGDVYQLGPMILDGLDE